MKSNDTLSIIHRNPAAVNVFITHHASTMTIYKFDFEENLGTDNNAKLVVEESLKRLLKTEEPALFSVVLHNDPVNTVEFVAATIKSVFGYSFSRSVWLMLTAHITGTSVLWTGECKKATEKCNKLRLAGPDPTMLKKGAEPLHVTVERQF